MNVLVIGDCSEELCNFIKKSKFCHKIYKMFSSPLENFANIEYANINDLCEKAKILKIDIALIMDGNFIQNGIGEFLKKQKINVIASSQKWFNLELSNFIAKQLVYHYSMNIPQIIKTPLSFPVVLKANENNYTKIINSMDELITEKVNLKDNNGNLINKKQIFLQIH